MKLSDYAKSKGISYKTAWRMYKAGKIPHQTEQLPTGSIIVYTDRIGQEGKTVLYARVSSYDQKDDLERQVQRLRDFSAEQGLPITQEITEIGSALNGKRKPQLHSIILV